MSETFRFPTPLGAMEASIGSAGEVSRLAFLDDAPAPVDGRAASEDRDDALAGEPGGSIAARTLIRQLDEYFDGERRKFALALDPEGTGFELAVWEALVQVPWGQTISYGTLAERIGRSDSARAVGGAVASNPIAIVVPCHRAIGSRGALTGYAGGIARKRALLELEGSLPLELGI
ncbi:MAG: methylated-DNA--[protein]-cysteine S-methyltransferase [Gemmatimonadota bacterium]|nr:methylated-DNA--[protein]-cysteine S-methyltransferase [Gemmatimonadota bacterium]